jgi:hypothetical protein
MGNTVKVKLIRTHVVAAPGEIITAFGHKFEMQPNGECHCDMHRDFIPTEVGAGRVEVIEPGTPQPEEVPELVQFTMEISDFYGTGSLEKLRTELTKCRKELLQEFASTRLQVDLPDTQPNNKMLKQIARLVQTAHQRHQQDNQKEQPEEDQEKEKDKNSSE